jgi:hypothetical protein
MAQELRPGRPHELSEATVVWLLQGDVSIQYQVRRDLLGEATTCAALRDWKSSINPSITN